MLLQEEDEMLVCYDTKGFVSCCSLVETFKDDLRSKVTIAPTRIYHRSGGLLRK